MRTVNKVNIFENFDKPYLQEQQNDKKIHSRQNDQIFIDEEKMGK